MGWIKPKGKRKKIQVVTYTCYWLNNDGMLFTTCDNPSIVGATRLTKYSYFQLMRLKQLEKACNHIKNKELGDAINEIYLIAEHLFKDDKVKKTGQEILVWATRSSAKNPRLTSYVASRITVEKLFTYCSALHIKKWGTKYGDYAG